MITYLVAFAVILLLLYCAVRVHMFLSISHRVEKDEEVSRLPHLHDVLFSH